MDKFYPLNSVRPISDESFDTMIGIMENFITLSSEFKAQLRMVLFEIVYKKGSNILNAGAKQSIVWFILDGLLREIAVDNETYTSETSWFWFNYSFVYAMPGFFDQEPSQVTINVVKDTKVVFIAYDKWKILKSSFQETERLTEMIRSHYELSRKIHLKEMNELSTVNRYLKHEAEIDQLTAHIQLKYIAEFMGMSTDTLGKLRRNLVKRKQPM